MKINKTYSVDIGLWKEFAEFCDKKGYSYSAQLSELMKVLIYGKGPSKME